MMRSITLAALMAGGVWLTGCTNHSSNDLAEAAFWGAQTQYDEDGNMLRCFTYYPDEEVYYSAFQNRYHWQSATKGWQSTVSLPSFIRVTEDSSMILMLPTAKPENVHEDVLAMHPSPRFLEEQIAMRDAQYEAAQRAEAANSPHAIANVPTDF